jgi:hypothetical protein
LLVVIVPLALATDHHMAHRALNLRKVASCELAEPAKPTKPVEHLLLGVHESCAWVTRGL